MFSAGFWNRGGAFFNTPYMDNCNMWECVCVWEGERETVCMCRLYFWRRVGRWRVKTVLLNSLLKMQNVFSLSVYVEGEQWGVEILWPSGSPGSSHSALLGKAGPPLFLFESLWKLARSWKLRSCHLEVYSAYARQSLFQTLQSYPLWAFPSLSWNRAHWS